MKRVGIEASQSDRVFADQVKLLYVNAPLAYSVTLVNGAILAYIQSAYIPIAVVLAWYGSLAAITIARAAAIWRYTRVRPGPEEARFWNIAYLLGAAAAGTAWGAAALVLFPLESIAHQVFIAFVLAGMAAGGIAVLSARMESCVAFLLPALLPLAVQYLTLRTPLHAAMGIMTLLFLAAMLLTARTLNRVIRTALNLRYDKQELEAEVALRKRAEEQLFHEKERLQTTVSSIAEGVALIDAEGHLEYLNPAAEQLLGRRCRDVLHRPPDEVFECFDDQDHRITTALEDCLLTSKPQKKKSVLYGKERRKYVIEELATPLYDRHGKLTGAVSVCRDITEEQRRAEQLAYAADHDVLTGLPNRNLLRDRTRQAVARAHRKHENFALLFVDLDSFKAVNDTLGHATGDALLVDVAKRLTECMREEDTIARLGGDEFVVLLNGPTHETQVEIIATKILHTLREPFQLGMQHTTVTASIGSSLYPGDGQDAESLLGHADAAMYRAKQRGRNQTCKWAQQAVRQ